MAEYRYDSGMPHHMHGVLLPVVERRLAQHLRGSRRLFDLGCGNGYAAGWFISRGWEVVGVDPSASGIQHARQNHPNARFEVTSADDNLAARFGSFPAVCALEVIEHVYAPRDLVRTVRQMLMPDGIFILSTPYHGYWKNLALSVAGKWDAHLTALWDHGHIKFWSVDTMTRLLEESGFEVLSVDRLGRIPCLAKTMVVVARHRT
ncbi:MAG: class I SAM-dependent methyltransferase [Candidatus Binatia bacterium]